MSSFLISLFQVIIDYCIFVMEHSYLFCSYFCIYAFKWNVIYLCSMKSNKDDGKIWIVNSVNSGGTINHVAKSLGIYFGNFLEALVDEQK